MATRIPDLDALRLLVEVAHHGSIGGAARAHGVTQQSASERLRAVEAQVGLTLVRRTARGSELTPQGVVLVEWASRLLEVADEVDTAIEGLRGTRRRALVVWSSLSIAETLLPRWLVRLRQRQVAEGVAATTVSLTATNSEAVADAVRSGKAHLGFVEGVGVPSGLRSTAVAHDELVLVTAPGTPLARRRRPLTPDDVAGLVLTTREPGSGTRDVVEHALAQHGLAPADGMVELTTAAAIRESVVAGGPPSFLSRRVVDRELDSGHLVVVPTTGLELGRTFRAVWSGTKQPPAGPVRDLVGLARTDAPA